MLGAHCGQALHILERKIVQCTPSLLQHDTASFKYPYDPRETVISQDRLEKRFEA